MPSTCPSQRASLTVLPSRTRACRGRGLPPRAEPLAHIAGAQGLVEVLSSPTSGSCLSDEARTMSDAYLAAKLAIAPRVV